MIIKRDQVLQSVIKTRAALRNTAKEPANLTGINYTKLDRGRHDTASLHTAIEMYITPTFIYMDSVSYS